MRARIFWIALPIAIALALWAGPGLGKDDEMPLPDPAVVEPPQPVVDPAPTHEAVEIECETPHDPGPDGDR